MKKLTLILMITIFVMCGCQPNSTNTSVNDDESRKMITRIAQLEKQLNETNRELSFVKKTVNYLNVISGEAITPAEVIKLYMKAFQQRDWDSLYALYDVPDDISYNSFVNDMKNSSESYMDFKVDDYKISKENEAVVNVSYTYKGEEGNTFTVTREPWRCIKKGGYWFVGWLPRQ